MVKMAKRPFEGLTELLERELGDRLRVVLRIEGAGIERLFVRDDLALRTDDELSQSFAHAFPGVTGADDLLPEVAGGPDCLVGFTAETVELILYRNPHEAVAVTFERVDGDALEEFVERCLASIH